MPIGTILSSIFSKGASTLVESVTNGLDNLITNKEELAAAKLAVDKEINRHLEAVQSEATKHLELELKDMSDARNREIQIATSEHAPLINKIIQPILALLVLGSCFIFWYIIIFRDIPKDKELLITGITSSLTTIAVGVISYFFGSSTGSKAKGDQIDILMQQKSGKN